MIWIIAVISALLLFIVLGLIWGFKTAFVRNNVRLIDLDSKSLSQYKEQFEIGFKYIDSYKSKRVFTKSYDNLKLAGKYFDNDSDSTIILFHGYRSDGRFDFACAVKYYIDMGLNVLIVDQRASGESEGKLITYGIKERHDVVKWAEFVNRHYAPKNIFLSGISMGASTVMMASNLNLPNNVRGIIADCGFTSASDIIKKVARESFKINATLILPLLNIGCKIYGKFSLDEIDTITALSQSNIPIFFIHGKCDGFVPCEMTEQSYQAAIAEKYICLVDDADHGVSFLKDTQNIQKQIAEFVTRYSS